MLSCAAILLLLSATAVRQALQIPSSNPAAAIAAGNM